MQVRLALLLVPLIAFPATAGDWSRCERHVLKTLRAKGLKDYKDSMAYTGAGGAGAYEDIVRQCGYKPMTERGCNAIYTNVYLSCRQSYSRERKEEIQHRKIYGRPAVAAEFGLSSVEWSWLHGYDPKIVDVDLLEAACKTKNRISRQEFGNRLCAGK